MQSTPDHVSGASAKTGATAEQQPMQGCVLRLFWMAAGNGLLLACGAVIAKKQPWTFSWVDAAFWAVVALLVAARFVDIRRFNGETSNGQPATMTHLKRYAVMLVLFASGLWVVAHLVAI